MGASINLDIFAEIRRTPKAVLCGITSQYGSMPLVAWLLCLALDLNSMEAITVCLLGMCPGGVTSTLFTYVGNGNVTLSLVMTTCSTFMALFMMPFLIWVYVRPPVFRDEKKTQVSYVAIISTLLVATIPAFFGWRLRRTRPGPGAVAEKWSTLVGIVFIVFLVVLTFAWPAKDSWGATPSSYAAAVIMFPCGFSFGYGFARLAGLDETTARTVSMETGIQQGGIAAAVIIRTYDQDDIDRALSVMIFFGFSSLFFGTVFAGLYRAMPVKDGSFEKVREAIAAADRGNEAGNADAPAAKATEFAEIAASGEGGFDC